MLSVDSVALPAHTWPAMATPDLNLQALVADIVRQVLADQDKGESPAARRSAQEDPPIRPGRVPRTHGEVAQPAHSVPPSPPRPLPGLDRLANALTLQALTKVTPSRIGVGRAGLRYPTATYLSLRTDHGFARDAVAAEPTPGFAASLGALELHSKAQDLQIFLLQPNQGRELDPNSLQVLRNQGTPGVDVQIILADGLSAWAVEKNPGLLAALQRELSAAGFSHGKPLWVHRARIAVADQIGVELGAKATVIGLGERPGLGTGDSLSLYLAWNPKLGQDNAEKNCISNVRPAGLTVQQAAQRAAQILVKARQLGQGGLAVAAPTRTW